ncbi:MAG TPA: aquaporin [Opitutaceae bacterium]|jgi:glycerol uptake facilitator protein|nr:aquaporin [Opitutaceae bacterium]
MKVPAWVVGEFLGTFLLVFFGCGSVAAATLLGAQVGIFQVAIVWGLGIALAIHLTGALSGAHLNPAVTCAFAACGRFPARRIGGYVAAQFGGAFTAAAALHAVYAGALRAYESAHGIVRGMAGSEATAMVFGEFYPNPGGQPLTAAHRALVGTGGAFLCEALGTALLVLVVLGATDEGNAGRPRELAPAMIGLMVTALISLLAPLTQAAFNPARDLAPRVWSALAGWGCVPFTANGWGWLIVYVFAPLAGGLAAALAYRIFLRPAYAAR